MRIELLTLDDHGDIVTVIGNTVADQIHIVLSWFDYDCPLENWPFVDHSNAEVIFILYKHVNLIQLLFTSVGW